ncbi:MAG: Arc family DNA-binding protein [Polaromonas sp.]|nr:Arc family DNA-binding protein [Polaromonas sp.]
MAHKDRHQLAPTPVRLPDALKAELKAEAQANDRSLNGEIVNRLRSTFIGKCDMRLNGAKGGQ